MLPCSFDAADLRGPGRVWGLGFRVQGLYKDSGKEKNYRDYLGIVGNIVYPYNLHINPFGVI